MRSLPHPLLCAAAALLAAAPRTQEGPTPPRVAALLRELTDGDRRGNASRALLALGEQAAVPLAARLSFEDPARARRVLALLGEMGSDGVACLDQLTEAASRCPDELLPELYRAITRLIPYVEEGGERTARLGAARNELHRLAGEQDELRERIAEEWFRTVQIADGHGGVSATLDAGTDELLGVLENGVHEFRVELACELLGRRGQASPEVVEALLERLRRPFHRSHVTTQSGKLAIRYRCGPRSNRVVAVALLRAGAPVEAQLEAHGYLLEHGLLHEQWDAIEAIRTHPGEVHEVVPALMSVAREHDDRELRGEAITTLGILGEQARDAAPLLETLSRDPDRGIAARAAAALRQVRGG